MAYQVEFDKRALKDLKKLDRKIASSIVTECALFETSPLSGPNIKCLRSNLYRLKVLRDWRVVYLVEGAKVSIILIGHRKDIYKQLLQRV